MKATYPVVFSKDETGYLVYVPDFDINTEGADITEAIFMARDAIGLVGITMQDENTAVPTPRDLSAVQCAKGEIVSLVDVDFDAYRRAHDNRSVRRNVTLPAWLDEKASESGINVSACLQEALKEKLKVE